MGAKKTSLSGQNLVNQGNKQEQIADADASRPGLQRKQFGFYTVHIGKLFGEFYLRNKI